MTAMTPLVHLVDNDPNVLRAVGRLLATAGIRTTESTSAAAFMAQYDASVPGCVVLDLSMPGESGLDLQRTLQRDQLPVPVVFLSGRSDVPASVIAMKHGAVDFLTKPVDADALIEAVQRGLEIDAGQRAHARDERELQAVLASLTPREREILPYLVSGMLNKQIAAALGVVEKTVKVHRMHVMQKLHVHRLADLVRLAERMHVVPVGPTAN
jgi:FixJ family two-component response regulator